MSKPGSGYPRLFAIERRPTWIRSSNLPAKARLSPLARPTSDPRLFVSTTEIHSTSPMVPPPCISQETSTVHAEVSLFFTRLALLFVSTPVTLSSSLPPVSLTPTFLSHPVKPDVLLFFTWPVDSRDTMRRACALRRLGQELQTAHRRSGYTTKWQRKGGRMDGGYIVRSRSFKRFTESRRSLLTDVLPLHMQLYRNYHPLVDVCRMRTQLSANTMSLGEESESKSKLVRKRSSNAYIPSSGMMPILCLVVGSASR